ncbi:MAG: polyprenyl synthetase family protein [Candidatus Caenarcaniphilales bacterium]|jgi:geranylgeranyl diphosphate synthase type II|nr:polyprenyl synthetase family protein [Candidatus Caenarcaniphilales bacterium]
MLDTIINKFKTPIEQALDDCLSNHGFEQSILDEALKYSVLNGGKRLRAILALLTAEAVLKKEFEFNENPAKDLALALELVHAGSLIHDDLPCMDNDDMRRGKATNHKVFGEATALLAGDFLLCYPILLLKNSAQAQEHFTKAILKMIIGQEMDMELTSSNSNDLNKLQSMEAHKTGALIEASVSCAAMIVAAKQNQIQALSQFASNIGLVFQITDDILDATATTVALGKTAGKDQAQDKFTYVKYYGLEAAQNKAKEIIQKSKDLITSIDIYPDKLLVIADYVLSRKN